MKKLNKVAMLFATAALATAAGAQTIDNWRNGTGDLVWKNGTNELCWRDASWTPATAAQGCDGAIVPRAAAPAPAPAPAAAPAPAPAAAAPAPAPAPAEPAAPAPAPAEPAPAPTEPAPTTPEEFAAHIRAEADRVRQARMAYDVGDIARAETLLEENLKRRGAETRLLQLEFAMIQH